MIINRSSLNAFLTASNAAFKRGLQRGDDQFDWAKIATLVNSSSQREEYNFLSDFPQYREWVGDRHIKNLEQFGYSLRNRTYESTIAIGREIFEDGREAVYGTVFEDMGYAAAELKEKLVMDALTASFTDTGYDGETFISSAHDSGTNTGGGTGDPWFLMDTSRPMKPLILQVREEPNLVRFTDMSDESVFQRNEYVFGSSARMVAGYGFHQQIFGSKETFSATDLDTAMQAMMAVRSPEGRPLGIKPTTLVVGPSNHASARDAIRLRELTGGGTNPHYQALELIVSPYLA